jgi:hypothetical protein
LVSINTGKLNELSPAWARKFFAALNVPKHELPFSSEHPSDRSFIRPVSLGAGSPSSLGTNSGRPSRSLLVKVIVGGTALFVVAGAYLSYQTVRSIMLENLKLHLTGTIEKQIG